MTPQAAATMIVRSMRVFMRRSLPRRRRDHTVVSAD
jgi:hypothetical protein